MELKRSLWLVPLMTLFAAMHLWGARVRIPDGTPVPVRLVADLRSDRVESGDRVDFEVARPVIVRGLVAIPEGAVAWGAVQGVKKDKEIKFDVQGVRLPDLREIKLRSIPKKTDNPGKDVIRLKTDMGTYVGALRGREFIAYLNEEVEVEGEPVQAAAPQRSAAPAAVTTPASAESTLAATAPASAPQATVPTGTAPAAVVPAPTPATTSPQAAAPQRTAPANAALAGTVPAQPVVPARTTPRVAVERVTVECFSIPSGAEILIDNDFYGHTPSILKLDATSHKLDLRLPGYKTHSQALPLTPATSLSTVRVTLERKP